jgi:hypothetical protein
VSSVVMDRGYQQPHQASTYLAIVTYCLRVFVGTPLSPAGMYL